MKLDNEFTVGVPIEQAWAVLTDLELIAPCMPGAQLTGVTDGVYTGKVKIKVGPVTAEYAGTAQFSVKDETAYRAVIDARGRDSRGNGNATAVISAQLQPVGASTVVSVSTDLTIAGRIAQFGSGMIKEVSAKLLGQFVTCLEGKLSGGTVTGATAAGAPVSPASAASTASTASTASAMSAAGAAPSGAAPSGAAPDSTAGGDGGLGTGPVPAGVTGRSPSSGAAASPAGDGGLGTGAATTPAATTSAAASVGVTGPEPAALDLMSVAGAAIYKRLVPLVVGLIVLAVVIYLIVR
jgi:uncharacterized protein